MGVTRCINKWVRSEAKLFCHSLFPQISKSRLFLFPTSHRKNPTILYSCHYVRATLQTTDCKPYKLQTTNPTNYRLQTLQTTDCKPYKLHTTNPTNYRLQTLQATDYKPYKLQTANPTSYRLQTLQTTDCKPYKLQTTNPTNYILQTLQTTNDKPYKADGVVANNMLACSRGDVGLRPCSSTK